MPFRTPQANFRIVRNKVQKLRAPLFKVRNSFQGAKISVQGAKIFASCKTTSWHTSAILHTSSQFLHRAKQGAKISHSAKLDSRCEILILRCENFASVGHIFEALPGAQIMHTIYRFEAWEVKNPFLQAVNDLDLK